MTLRKSISLAAIAATMLFTSVCFAQVNILHGGVTGQWYQLSRNGEGLFVEVVNSGGHRQFVVSWFTYDQNGNQMWLVGNVVIEGDPTSITVPVVVTSGPTFGPSYDPADVVRTFWGTLTLTFPDCSSAVLTYQSDIGFGSGVINLTRLTNVTQVRCFDSPPSTGLTPGTWIGDGVCFNVSQDGTALTPEGSACDDGRAFDANVDGTNMQGMACRAEVKCQGVVEIVDGTFSCGSDDGQAVGTFTSTTTASGLAEESDRTNSCDANWTAMPSN